MTMTKYQTMKLNDLRRYILTHREDIEDFQVYIDRSKSAGKMISLNDAQWEEKVKNMLKKHHSQNDINDIQE